MKRLHEFKLPKEIEVEETFTETDDKGQEKTITTKIKKYVDQVFYLRKPNRKLFDEAELYYAVKLSEGIRAGLLTRALLQKRFANDGGILSDPEKTQWNDLYNEVFEKQVQMQTLSLKTKEERSSKENASYDELILWLQHARKEIQEFEMTQSSLYDQTAENRARNKTILWWVLFLAYQESDDEKEDPYFGPGDYEDKIKHYDKIEELEEEWEQEVISKFFYYVSFWYVSKTNSKEEFLEMLKYAETQELSEEGDEVDFPLDEEGTEQAAKEHVAGVVKEALKKEEDKKEKPKEEKPKEEKPKEEKPKEEKPKEKKPKEEKPKEKKDAPKTEGEKNQDSSSNKKKEPKVFGKSK